MNIRNMIGEKNKKVAKYKATQNMSDVERRSFEETSMKPERLQQYTGQPPPMKATDPLLARSVRIILPNQKYLAMFGRHFKVSDPHERCCAYIDSFLAFLEALDNGTIMWDKQLRKLQFNQDVQTSDGQPNRKGSNAVGAKQQGSKGSK